MAARASSPRSSSPRKKPSLDFTVVGLVYTCMMLFLGLAAINSQVSLLFAVFGLMIGVLLVAALISRAVLRKLDIRRVLPEYAVVGRPATVVYEFINRKRYLPSLSVTLGEFSSTDAFTKQPQAYLLHVAAGARTSVPALVVPTRRGLHPLDRFQVCTSFPFGFIRRASEGHQKDSILVHSPIAEVDRHFLSMCISAEQSGSRMRPRRGGLDEFYGVKEFRSGENPRWIYWRRSARTGTLVAKEMTHVARPRVLVIVDTFLAERTPAAHAAVERAIAMAASIVTRAAGEGLAVGLCAWSGRWISVPLNRGKRHSRELLAILARLPLNVQAPRRDLVESAQHLLHDGITPLLFTPTDVEQSLADQARGNWIVVAADSELAQRSFRFDSTVDFQQCVPPDQAPKTS